MTSLQVMMNTLNGFIGRAINDHLICTINDNGLSIINSCELANVVKAIKAGGDQPPPTDVLDQLVVILTYQFRFCLKIQNNMERLCTESVKDNM